MKKRLGNLNIQQDEFIELIEAVEKELKASLIPKVNDLLNLSTGRNTIVSSLTFNSFNFKDDPDFFNTILNILTNYSKALPDLKSKVVDHMPDNINTGTNNLNVKLTISILSVGIYFINNLMDILTYLVTKFYNNDNTTLEESVTRRLVSDTILFINNLKELEHTNYKELINVIGNIPELKTLRSSTDMPSELITEFFKTNFHITDFYSLTFVKKIMGYFKLKKENKSHPELSKSFIGNPIYHIRLFIVDLEMLRLDYLKERRRLLELRILELRSRAEGGDSTKINKQIRYLEDKVNKLNRKIENIIEIQRNKG